MTSEKELFSSPFSGEETEAQKPEVISLMLNNCLEEKPGF